MVDPRYYTNRNGIVLTSLAGPLTNFLLAFITLVVIKLNVFGGLFAVFLEVLFSYNLVLAVFNLLPIAPLDGYKILTGLLPWRMSDKLVYLETYGPLILIFIVYFNLVHIILDPFMSISLRVLDRLSDILLIFRF
jgi:Zn-dependent protease